MFIFTKWTYLLYLIIISSCYMFWEFIISCALWLGSIRLVLCWCWPILFHGSISSLSIAFDIHHFLGLCFIILLFNFWSNSWCVTVLININYFCVAVIFLQWIYNFVFSFFLLNLIWWILLFVLGFHP